MPRFASGMHLRALVSITSDFLCSIPHTPRTPREHDIYTQMRKVGEEMQDLLYGELMELTDPIYLLDGKPMYFDDGGKVLSVEVADLADWLYGWAREENEERNVGEGKSVEAESVEEKGRPGGSVKAEDAEAKIGEQAVEEADLPVQVFPQGHSAHDAGTITGDTERPNIEVLREAYHGTSEAEYKAAAARLGELIFGQRDRNSGDIDDERHTMALEALFTIGKMIPGWDDAMRDLSRLIEKEEKGARGDDERG